MAKESTARLSSAQRQLRILQREAVQTSNAEEFARQLARMEEQLAGFEVAYEELEQQNEELQTTREALERQRHRYRHLFEEAPFGYLVTDVNGTIEEANRAAADLFAVRQDLLAGKPFTVFLDLEDRSAFRDLLRRVGAGEPGGEMEVRIKSRDGALFSTVLTGVRDADAENRTARLRWTVRDISKTKAAEEALRASEERLRHSQRLEAVGRLAGGIAHSFNNLLAAISFQCELLFESTPEEDGRRAHVEEIQRAGERAAALARQLLAYGRKQTLQPRTLSLNDVIREMAPMLRRLIGEHIRLEIALDPQDGAVHVDLGQIEQVILNLAVNARDALRAGGTLRLAAESLDLAAGEVAELPAGSYVRLT
ncbi:MAG TPA: PAS domain S-box protein, partial [Thermoanaerobaculia bacterium]